MEPVILKDILPCAALENYIRKFQVIRFSFEKHLSPPVKFHAPRPEHSITFYVRDPQKFSAVHSDDITVYSKCVVNGMYTMPINRHGGHDFLAIKAVLQPTTLSRMRLVNVKELNNSYINGEDCFGSEIKLLCEELFYLDELKKMIEAIENFLIRLVNRKCKSHSAIDKLAEFVLQDEEERSLGWLAEQSYLSRRQFIRRFEDNVGISLKMFQKLVRFDRAFRLKNNHPDLDWLYIAVACGYYDYQHLSKDFKEFTHLTPPAFYEIEKKSPERYFSLHEC